MKRISLKIKNNEQQKVEHYQVTHNGSEYVLSKNISNLNIIHDFVERFRHQCDLKSFLAHIEQDYKEKFKRV